MRFYCARKVSQLSSFVLALCASSCGQKEDPANEQSLLALRNNLEDFWFAQVDAPVETFASNEYLLKIYGIESLRRINSSNGSVTKTLLTLLKVHTRESGKRYVALRALVLLNALDDPESLKGLQTFKDDIDRGDQKGSYVSALSHYYLRKRDMGGWCHPLLDKKVIVVSSNEGWSKAAIDYFKALGAATQTGSAVTLDDQLARNLGITDVLLVKDLPSEDCDEVITRTRVTSSVRLIVVIGVEVPGAKASTRVLAFPRGTEVTGVLERLVKKLDSDRE